MLDDVRTYVGTSKWLFPSNQRKGHIRAYSMTVAIKKHRDAWSIADFTSHDLRRTAASHMTGMGISRLTVSKLLNHAESGVTAVYDRHSYDTEKRRALDAWGRKIESIVTGGKDNVVGLHTAR